MKEIHIRFSREEWEEFFNGDFYSNLPETTKNTMKIYEKSIVIIFVEYFSMIKTSTSKCTTRFSSSTCTLFLIQITNVQIVHSLNIHAFVKSALSLKSIKGIIIISRKVWAVVTVAFLNT